MAAMLAGSGLALESVYMEGVQQSLSVRAGEDEVLAKHAAAREASEQAWFADIVASTPSQWKECLIPKGEVNSQAVVEDILAQTPDVLFCYGSSLIKSQLLEEYKGRFINLHLGLSPYYRGSGTNVAAIIDGNLAAVGATFMHMDAGIDTGAIIHQLRARVEAGDTPHSIGNRLILDAAKTAASLVLRKAQWITLPQPEQIGTLVKRMDFTRARCEALYQRFESGLVERYLSNQLSEDQRFPLLTQPCMEGA